MTREEHIARHVELHKALDELVADWISNNQGVLPSKATVLDLMQWAQEQAIAPTERDT